MQANFLAYNIIEFWCRLKKKKQNLNYCAWRMLRCLAPQFYFSDLPNKPNDKEKYWPKIKIKIRRDRKVRKLSWNILNFFKVNY